MRNACPRVFVLAAGPVCARLGDEQLAVEHLGEQPAQRLLLKSSGWGLCVEEWEMSGGGAIDGLARAGGSPLPQTL